MRRIGSGDDTPEWAWRMADEALDQLDAPVNEPVAKLIADDLVATLGITTEQAITAVRHQSGGRWDDDGFAVAENVQQWLHDTFIDPIWPACPDHHRHPLWLDDHQPPRWTCPTTHQPLCELGQLAAITTTTITPDHSEAMRHTFDEEARRQREFLETFRRDRRRRPRDEPD